MSLVDQVPTQSSDITQGQEPPSIIYPPPDTRRIVDRTAAFVARNDRSFEDKVRESKRDNPQFSFLNPGDPYYAYYRYEVSRNAAILLDPTLQDTLPKPTPAPLPPQVAAALAPQPPAQPKPIPQPPPPYQFKLDIPSISAQDLDIIKLTALFVARNGPQFRAGLTQREGRNYQFDFLRPGHSLFPSFNRLVEQYSAVLLPSKPTLARLNEARQDKSLTLDRVMKHVEYSLYEETQRKQAAAKEDQERMAYAAIDWHDFVIVQTLEFTETDQSLELPPPIRKEDLAGLTLAARRAATMGPNSTAQEYGQQGEAWNEEAAVKEETEVPQAEPAQPTVTPMKIRKDYIPKAMVPRTGSEQTQACPICGINLPMSEIDEHIRVESLDPKWKEQKAVLEKRQRDSNLVGSSADVTKHLKSLSTYRSDLFGSDEVGIGKKIEEDAQRRKQAEKEKPVYDGFSTLPSNQNKSMDDQIAALHRKVSSAPAPQPSFQPQQTFTQPPPFQPYNFAPPPPFAPPVHPAPFFPPGNFGPPMHHMDAKRFKMDDPLSQLLPEQQWIAMHPTPYNVQVTVPNDPSHPDWNLNGQLLWIEDLPANTTIQQIKDRLAEMLGFPASKQKLTVHPANPNLGPQVAKNSYSLAVYNIPPNGKIDLAIKERGGKK